MNQTRSCREDLIVELLRGSAGASSEGLARTIELLSVVGREEVLPPETRKNELKAQLLAQHQELSRSGTAVFRVMPTWRWGIAGILLLLVGALIPAVAQDILSRLTIIEVDRIPEVIEVQPWQTNTDFRVEHREAVPLSELKANVGFPIFVPSVLPPGCDFGASYLIREPENEVVVDYQCLTIFERTSEGRIQYWIYARTGETQWLTLNGKPALLVKGVWRFYRGLEEAMWDPNHLQLFFEREGVLIRFSTGIELEDLLKVAESMVVQE